MKKNILYVGATVFLLLITAIIPVNAQLCKKESESLPLYTAIGSSSWMKTYGNPNEDSMLGSIQQTTDGGYITVGFTGPYFGNHDVWLVKIQKNGNMAWEKTFGGSSPDEGWYVRQTSDGGYIIAGVTESFGSSSNENIYLIKTDENGGEEWSKTFGGSGSTNSGSPSVQQTTDGGYIIGGYNGSNACLIKIDASGNKEWEKNFDKSNYHFASAYCVQQTTDGGYIIIGRIGSAIIGSSACLLKTDANGNVLWDKTWEYSDSIRVEGTYVEQTTDGGYIALVNIDKGHGDWYLHGDTWLIKTDTNGNTEWDKIYSRIAGSYVGTSVHQITDGGYIIAGAIQTSAANLGDIFLLKTNSHGKEMWERIYGFLGQAELGLHCEQTSDGGYIIAGTKVAGVLQNKFEPRNLVIKTNANGQVSKAKVKSFDSTFISLLERFPRLSRLLSLFPTFTRLINS